MRKTPFLFILSLILFILLHQPFCEVNIAKHITLASIPEAYGQISIPTASIIADGNTADWAGIAPLATDPQGDSSPAYAGDDIEAFYVAKDATNLYLRLDLWENANPNFANGPAPNDGRYKFVLFNNGSYPNLKVGVANDVFQGSHQWILGYNGSNEDAPSELMGAQYVGVSGGVIEAKIPLSMIGDPTIFTGFVASVENCCATVPVITFDTVSCGELPKETLTITLAGAGSGTVTADIGTIDWNGNSGTTSYDWNVSVTLTPTASNGSIFSNWLGCDATHGNLCTVTMNGAKNVTALFTLESNQYILTITKSGTGEGNVTVDTGTVNWTGNTGVASYDSATLVTLTANAGNSSTFTSWTGCDSTTGNQCTVTMNGAKSVTATFTLDSNQYVLTITKSGTGDGNVTVDTGTVNWNEDAGVASYDSVTLVTLTATPSNGSTFTSWMGCDSTNGNLCTATIDAERNITATFTLLQDHYPISLTKIGEGSGAVTSSPSGIKCGDYCSKEFNRNIRVTLTAKAAFDSTFMGWDGACSGIKKICSLTMDGPKEITANFVPIPHLALAVTKTGEGSGTVTGSPTGTVKRINCGTDCSDTYLLKDPNRPVKVTLTAKPAFDSLFGGWSGACSGALRKCTVLMDGNKEVTANFTPIPRYTLTVKKEGEGSGWVTARPTGIDKAISCGPECNEDSATYLLKDPSRPAIVRLSASPMPGSVFRGWSGACSRSGLCQVTMNQDVSVTATFSVDMSQTSLLDGSFQYTGPLPNTASVTYPTKSGDTLTVEEAYAGMVTLFVSTSTPEASVRSSVQTNGGNIIAQIPRIGLYVVLVATGQEGAFLVEMYKQEWVEEGSPSTSAVRGSLAFDWDSAVGTVCAQYHGTFVKEIMGRRSNYASLEDVQWQSQVDGKLPAKLIEHMEEAHRSRTRLVLNMSLQSEASESNQGNSPGCDDNICRNVRDKQYLFFRQFYTVMEEMFKNHSDIANNTIITIIAGNAGVDLDNELVRLQEDFPNAFRRMRIVGGTGTDHKIYTDFNHVDDNSKDLIVYSRAEDVEVGGTTCSGTSFAGPEVAGILDYIWSRNPALSSDQVIAALMAALNDGEVGNADNIIPQDSDGYTRLDFIQKAVQIAGGKVSSYTLTITKSGTGSGAVDALPAGPKYPSGTKVNTTATASSDSTFAGWSGACSGTGSCVITMNSNKSLTARFNLIPLPTSAVFKGGFAGTTTVTYPGFCKWDHTVSGEGTATVSEWTTATFSFSGVDVWEPVPGSFPECQSGSASATYAGTATIDPDGTITAHGSIGDGTGDFIGTPSADKNSVTGTLTINNPAFDSPIVGPLILIKQ